MLHIIRNLLITAILIVGDSIITREKQIVLVLFIISTMLVIQAKCEPYEVKILDNLCLAS